MRVLVTGNLGYVGSVMTPLLRRAGHEVWGCDVGFFENCVFGAPGDPGIDRQITKDIRRLEAPDLAGVEAVIHLAALSNDPTGELDPQLTHEINFEGTMRVARLAKAAGASRFLFASSCSIYGQGGEALLTEDSPMTPLTAYAVSKVRAEAALHELADDRFSPVSLRNATAYGFSVRPRFDVVVNNLTGWAVTTGEVRLMSDGKAWRPLVHVADMSSAFVAALAAPRDHVHAQAFNVGREADNRRIRDLAEAVATIVPHCRVTIAEGASTDARNYNVSFDKLRRVLPEFEPRWNVELGIRELADAFIAGGLTRERFEGREFTRLKQLQHLIDGGLVDRDLMWTAARPA